MSDFPQKRQDGTGIYAPQTPSTFSNKEDPDNDGTGMAWKRMGFANPIPSKGDVA